MMCCASNSNIPSFIGWGEWQEVISDHKWPYTSGGHKHWVDPAVSFLGGGGGGDMTKRPKPGYTQNWKFRWIRPLFFLGGAKTRFRKKIIKNNVPFATGKGGPQIIENLTEVYICDVEEKCTICNRLKLDLNRFWMRKHPISGRFLNLPKKIWKFWT